MSLEHDAWVKQARAVHIEDELARRNIKVLGKTERDGPCPKCGGDDRFAINIKKQLFNCRGCKVGGDVIDFVRWFDGVGFVEACTTLAGPPPQQNGKDHAAIEPRRVCVAIYAYHDEDGYRSQNRLTIWAPYILFDSQYVDITANEAMAAAGENKSPATRDAAKKFLLKILANGPVPKTDIDEAAEANGITKRTLDRAKAELNVEAEKDRASHQGTWTWRLPDKPKPKHWNDDHEPAGSL